MLEAVANFGGRGTVLATYSCRNFNIIVLYD